MLCGLEVVLPDGEVVRTGFGAQEDNSSWHVYKHGFGPDVQGLFQQSGMGIVTRAGVWLMPRPEEYVAGNVIFRGDTALAQAIDVIRGLMLSDIITNLPMFTRGIEVDENGREYVEPNTDRWSARFALYGSPALNDAKLVEIRKAVAGIDGAELVEKRFAGNDHEGPANLDDRVQIGIPDMDLLNPDFLPFGENTAHLDLSPAGPAIGADVVRLQTLMRDLYAAEGRDYVGGIYLNKRHALQFSTTFYDPRNQEQTEAVFATYGRMVEELADQGYLPYRTNLQHMDLVADKFSFNDHAYRRLVETIKDAVDPAGILAPGKQGIWPKHLRQG
jgi:4-cresol dehydrogenase (hydroxylating)